MMFRSKTVLIVLAIAGLALLVVALLFYYVLKNKTKDISDRAPYSEMLNKPITTLEDALYMANSSMELTTEYPNELQDFESIDTSRVAFTLVPKGSILQFHKAIQVHRAVSGSRYAFLLGEVRLKDTNEKVPLLYHWGTFKSICIDTPCNYWEHKKAPWQTVVDAKKYFE
jgi:hypothetical protein